ncbi:hypothetical protein [Rhodanobacter aciditrophus]|uniref:hypothetical protein n=1 Tax=Rhodanobacter aciditrophus TaxID=1623218 RepID=UPI003CEBDD98
MLDPMRSPDARQHGMFSQVSAKSACRLCALRVPLDGGLDHFANARRTRRFDRQQSEDDIVTARPSGACLIATVTKCRHASFRFPRRCQPLPDFSQMPAGDLARHISGKNR